MGKERMQSEETFHFLDNRLERIFGSAGDTAALFKVLSRAEKSAKETIPQYFLGAVTAEQRRFVVEYLLKAMVEGLAEKHPDDPLKYLSQAVKEAKTPRLFLYGSLIPDYVVGTLPALIPGR